MSMRYTYDVFREELRADGLTDKRVFTTTNIEELKEGHVRNRSYVMVYDNINQKIVNKMVNKEDLEDWKIGVNEGEARAVQWKDKEKDHINPDYYQAYMTLGDRNLQWIEAQQFSSRFTFEEMNKAIELQVRKYIDREGGKDHSVQELKKAYWYFQLWLARHIAGRPVYVNEIKEILKDDN